MEIKIDKNVPIPKKKGAGRKEKYPFSKMEITDSFLIKCSSENLFKVQNTLNTSAHRYAGRCTPTKKFKTARMDGGIRVWRVK